VWVRVNSNMPLVDFAILTGLTEEFMVLKELLPELVEDPDSAGAEIWYRGRIRGKTGVNYEIVAAYQDDMGPLEAHALTGKVIWRWNPAYILLVGIAGSFDEKVGLGDVIVSQQIFYYDPGKAIGGGIQYRPQGYPCSTTLIRQTEALQVDAEALAAWQESANRSAVEKARRLTGEDAAVGRAALLGHRPKIHFGTVASGSLVIASVELQRKLLALHGKIIGTEMEGAGVLHATFREDLPTPAVVIKGISDAADDKKESEDEKGYWRDLAKENSVRLALDVVRRGRIRPLYTDQFVLDVTRGSAAEFRDKIPDPASSNVSCLAFPRLVTPRGPLTRLQIETQVVGEYEGRNGELDVIRRVVEYTSSDGERVRESQANAGTKIVIGKPLAAEPIGFYLMVRGTPRSIQFTTKGPSGDQTAEWVAHS